VRNEKSKFVGMKMKVKKNKLYMLYFLLIFYYIHIFTLRIGILYRKTKCQTVNFQNVSNNENCKRRTKVAGRYLRIETIQDGNRTKM